jgi:hypothetical protein
MGLFDRFKRRNLDSMNEDLTKMPRQYYWVGYIGENGQPDMLNQRFYSFGEAHAYAQRNLNVEFSVFPIYTGNINEARRRVIGKMMAKQPSAMPISAIEPSEDDGDGY